MTTLAAEPVRRRLPVLHSLMTCCTRTSPWGCRREPRRDAAANEPATAAQDAEGPPGRAPGARGGARALGRARAAARPSDRTPAPDPGSLRASVGRASCRAGAGDEARAHGSL